MLCLQVAATWANTQFAGYESWQVALLTASVTVLVIAAIQVSEIGGLW